MSTTLYFPDSQLFGVIAANARNPEGEFWFSPKPGTIEQFSTPSRFQLAPGIVEVELLPGEEGYGMAVLRALNLSLKLSPEAYVVDEAGHQIKWPEIIMGLIGETLMVSDFPLPDLPIK